MVVLFFCAAIDDASAEFTLNFSGPQTGNGGWVYIDCNRGGWESNCGGGMMGGPNDPDDTPFLQEIVTDGVDQYFHLIIGDPSAVAASDGAGGDYIFAQETYTKIGATYTYGTWWTGSEPGSSSAGALDNGSNPFAQDAGNGTGNPSNVQIRMILEHNESDGATFTQEYLKTFYDKKPLITQQVSTSEITLEFSADMSSIAYNDSSTAGTVVNTLTLTNEPTGIGDFDIAVDGQDVRVTAGRYIYTAGSGPGGGGGVYTYWDGGFDPTAISDWNIYCDPGQNTLAYNCDPLASGRTNEGANSVVNN